MHRTLVTVFRERIDIARFFCERGRLKAEVRIGESIRRRIPQQCAPLQRTAAQFEGKRISPPGQIQLAHLENSARCGFDLRPSRARGAGESLHFESAAVGQRVTLGLFDQNSDVLFWICPGGILWLDRDAIENPEVVKTPLRFHDVPFA